MKTICINKDCVTVYNKPVAFLQVFYKEEA